MPLLTIIIIFENCDCVRCNMRNPTRQQQQQQKNSFFQRKIKYEKRKERITAKMCVNKTVDTNGHRNVVRCQSIHLNKHWSDKDGMTEKTNNYNTQTELSYM